eukprot:3686509-Alexandrium_andersonii.AAC.1
MAEGERDPGARRSRRNCPGTGRAQRAWPQERAGKSWTSRTLAWPGECATRPRGTPKLAGCPGPGRTHERDRR